MAELRLESLSKTYRAGGATGEGTTALSDVDLRVADGEFFTLVGPSGCGKTTTLRLVAGFEEPTTGSVRFDGRSMDGVPPEDRDAGIVFQNYALFPHMSVAENVAYGLRFRDPPGGATTDERVADLLALVDLAGMGDRDPDQLSGGQQQRVALARALAPGPGLLLLDEPMSALDARLRERLRRQLKRIQGDLGVTTLYVTHDQEEALAVSDRLAVMHDGRVEQVGTPREVYREPATEFVAEFVGENNVLTGRVSAVETEGLDVVTHDTTLRLPASVDAGAGDEILFCVRPEVLTPGATANRLDLAVENWEFLGESVRVFCDWDGRPLTVRLPDVPDGETLTVGFEPSDAHVVRVDD